MATEDEDTEVTKEQPTEDQTQSTDGGEEPTNETTTTEEPETNEDETPATTEEGPAEDPEASVDDTDQQQLTEEVDKAADKADGARDIRKHAREVRRTLRRAREETITVAELALLQNGIATRVGRVVEDPEEARRVMARIISGDEGSGEREISLEDYSTVSDKIWKNQTDAWDRWKERLTMNFKLSWNSASGLREKNDALRTLLHKKVDKTVDNEGVIKRWDSEFNMLTQTKTLEFKSKTLIEDFEKYVPQYVRNLGFVEDTIEELKKDLDNAIDRLYDGKPHHSVNIMEAALRAHLKIAGGKPKIIKNAGKTEQLHSLLFFGNGSIQTTKSQSSDIEEQLFVYRSRFSDYHEDFACANVKDKHPLPTLTMLRHIPEIVDKVIGFVERWVDRGSKEAMKKIDGITEDVDKKATEILMERGMDGDNPNMSLSRITLIAVSEVNISSAVCLYVLKLCYALVKFGAVCADQYLDTKS